MTVSASLLSLSAACGPSTFEVVEVDDDRELRAIAIGADGRGWIVGRRGALHRYAAGRVEVATYSFEDSTGRTRTLDLFAAAVHRGAAWIAGDDGLMLRTSVAPSGEPDDLVDETTGDLPFVAQAEASGSFARWLTLAEVTPSVLLAGGEGATVRQRRNQRWDGVDAQAPLGARITGAWSGGEAIVLTTDRGVVLERDARGAWMTQTVATETATVPVPLFDVWSSTAGADLYVVGLGGALFRRSAERTEWQRMPTPVDQDLYAIDGRSEREVYAVGAAGTILRFDGVRWSRTPSSTGRDLFDVVVGAGEVVAVGSGGAVVRFVP